MVKSNACPVCQDVDGETAQVQHHATRDAYVVDCPACGHFTISRTAVEDARMTPEQRRSLSHDLCWRSEFSDDERPFITSQSIDEAIRRPSLPGVGEQIDNALAFLTRKLVHMGRKHRSIDAALISAIGAIDLEAAASIVGAMSEAGLVKAVHAGTMSGNQYISIEPTFRGWIRAEEIRKGDVAEKFAFMAMKYGDPELEAYVANVFRPAVQEAGYDLEILRDRPQAGLIDSYLRSRLKLCKFVIADLTHANNGAYWEAGYAEGLGKPVIYTCHGDTFSKQGTHFDTSHSQTIVWLPDQPDEAKRQLVACVRNSVS